MASGTDGNLITYDASGDPAYVTTGTSGQVLTSGGTGVAPTFQTAAGGGGGWELVTRTEISSNVSSVSFTSLTADTPYLIVGQYIVNVSGAGVRDLGIQFSDDNGSSWKTASYLSTLWQTFSSSGTDNQNLTNCINLSDGGESEVRGGTSFNMYIDGMSDTADRKPRAWGSSVWYNGGARSGNIGGMYDGGNMATNAVRILEESGQNLEGHAGISYISLYKFTTS